MSRPERADLDSIIQSPEAGVFLGMVTKGFYERSYMGLWIFEIIGREWDEMKSWAEGMKDEIHPQTCTWSIPIWEWVYGIPSDDALPLPFRRQRVLAKIIATVPVNPEAIRRGVAALVGAYAETVEVDEGAGPYRFDVIIHPAEVPVPFPYSRIARYIRETKPSHLCFKARLKIHYPWDFSDLMDVWVPAVRMKTPFDVWGADYHNGRILHDGRNHRRNLMWKGRADAGYGFEMRHSGEGIIGRLALAVHPHGSSD